MAKVALLIGVSEYGAGLNPLPGAVKDVEAIREVLLHSDIGGFASGDVKLLKNPQRQEMEEAIESLFLGRQKDDLVLLYFSGHGIKDDTNRLYLTTRTTRKTERGELIRSTAVAASFVHDSMGRSRSKRQVVVLDSCFSGAFAEGLLARDDGSVDIRTELGGEGRAVLTSSTSTQYSFEEKGEDLSIYTRFLLEGIRTGAADLDDDGVISIDELHEYASRKVQEFQPAMKPELYAIREGFKIRLTKVPPGDPLQKYRKEVARFIHRGEISFVGRRTLDVLRSRLTLEPTAAQSIEDEVLEPCRQEFRNKLQQYEQVFTEVLQRDQTITEGDRADLQNLQQILGLRNEDTVPIEATVTARLKTHQKNLQTYEQAFAQTLRQEFSLNDASRTRLAQLKQQLELADAEVSPIEMRITAEVESYHQNLQQYEQLFVAAIQRSYPLPSGDENRNELQQQQESLGLSKVDVAPIEAKITAEIKTYQQKIQQYEQTYVDATKRRKHHLSESDRKQLEQTWQTLGLREDDVRAIESQITTEIEIHQTNLQRYEQKFVEATQKHYPFNENERHLLNRQQRAWDLSDEEVVAIEHHITSKIEEHLQKLQQYEQVFKESVQFEYPLSTVTREELQRFQQILDLSHSTILSIEQKVIQLFQPLQLNQSSLSDEQNIAVQLPISQQDKSLGQEEQPLFLSSTTETTNNHFSEQPRDSLASIDPVLNRNSSKNRGVGQAINFPVDMQDIQGSQLPARLPQRKALPLRQVLLLLLAVLGVLGSVSLGIWLLFLKPLPLEVMEFKATGTNYIEGDPVKLNWTIRNPSQIKRIELKTQGPNPVAPVIFNFQQDKPPDSLKPPRCDLSSEELRCNNVLTSARAAGKYTFELIATSRSGNPLTPSKTELEIVAKPDPKVTHFQPDESKYKVGEAVKLTWRIEEVGQLQTLNVVAEDGEGKATTIPVFQNNQVIAEFKDLCKRRLKNLTCANVPIAGLSLGQYSFSIQGINTNGVAIAEFISSTLVTVTE